MKAACAHRLPGFRFALVITAMLLSRPVPGSGAEALPKVRVKEAGRVFEAAGKEFRPLGLTYYRPGTGWAPQVWKQFDAEATRADFARMKELGVNCVRVFISYGSFLMESSSLDGQGIAKFDQFLQIAEQAGIYVHPTGPDHWEGTPAWAQEDRVADERLLQALESFWKLFAARYRGRNVIFAYDLRNEPEVAWDTPVLREKWNRWIARKYASPQELASAWGSPERCDPVWPGAFAGTEGQSA